MINIIYRIILFILTLIPHISIADCYPALEQTLAPYHGKVNSQDISSTFNFDCKESNLIESLGLPYSDSHENMKKIIKVLGHLPFPFIEDSLDILRPYCRNEKSWFGSFCMAVDVDSAELMTHRQDLIDKLPEAILLISQVVNQQEKFNLIDVLSPLFKMNHINRRSLVLLASFLGLDDNGVQTSRLMANLLYTRDFKNYSKLFPVFFQTGDLPAIEGEADYTNHFGKLLFATRVGNARIPGLKRDQKKTYKAYAGVYLGCRMAILGHPRWIVAAEGYAMGYTYEVIKTKSFFGKPINELTDALTKYHSKGKDTGAMMKIGTLYGYDLCQI